MGARVLVLQKAWFCLRSYDRQVKFLNGPNQNRLIKMVHEIATAAEFKEKVLDDKDGSLIVVDFFAQWCAPCKMIAPKIDAMAKDEFPEVKFFKVDVDENEELAAEQGISAMPTFHFFRNGQKLEDVVMGANEGKIKELIKKLTS